jgi:hypothetical protein
MNSNTTPRFWQMYAPLPASIRLAARQAYQQFQVDPRHPGLHFHRLVSDPRLWSLRITRDCRAVGLLQGDTITWFWIGTHAEFDRDFPR